MKDHDEFTIEPYSKLSLNFKELWSYRELFYFFAWRDVRVKFKQTVLGILWVILQPLLLMLIFTYFFGRVLQVDPAGIPYPVFVLSGLILWNFFSACISNAGNSMVSNASIIKKIYFPRLIIPVSTILASMVDLLITFVIFIFFLIVYGSSVDFTAVLFWPMALLLTLTTALGLGCWLSALMIKYRDFRFIVPFALQIAFFITPIVYPITNEKWPLLKYLVAANPMYGAITLFRRPLMVNADVPVELIGISMLSAVVLLLMGLTYFRKTELYFADVA